jgi:hypothetical protein
MANTTINTTFNTKILQNTTRNYPGTAYRTTNIASIINLTNNNKLQKTFYNAGSCCPLNAPLG